MKPFIAKYCRTKNDAAILPMTNYTYCSKSEMMLSEIKKNNFVYAIDDSTGIQVTGSLLTDAYGDPSRDESTDR